MANVERSVPDNVPGDFFVDTTCIDCATCNWVAPTVFGPASGTSRVFRQPDTAHGRHRARMALVACPVGAIGTREPHDISDARTAFPDRIDGAVYHCGYHARASFGAASYLIVRPEGNVLIDSPRFSTALVRGIEEMGGVDIMFLTHRDDVADHDRFAAHFSCTRVLHEAELGPRTRDVEWVVTGPDDVDVADDLTAIVVPGHTRGSMCLLHDDRHLFTGDHLEWDPADERPHARHEVCWYDWREQAASMARLAEYDFEWVLPGHGYPGRMQSGSMRGAMTELVTRMGAD